MIASSEEEETSGDVSGKNEIGTVTNFNRRSKNERRKISLRNGRTTKEKYRYVEREAGRREKK